MAGVPSFFFLRFLLGFSEETGCQVTEAKAPLSQPSFYYNPSFTPHPFFLFMTHKVLNCSTYSPMVPHPDSKVNKFTLILKKKKENLVSSKKTSKARFHGWTFSPCSTLISYTMLSHFCLPSAPWLWASSVCLCLCLRF
jgi:hypothetical protein